MILAMEAGAHMVDLVGRGIKRVIGSHHPLGESVFVNHTHDNLTAQYGLEDHDDAAIDRRPPPKTTTDK